MPARMPSSSARARPGLQQGHHLGLPPAVDAGAHQIVHQIVAPGDAVEYRTNQRGLVGFRHPAKAEIGLSSRGLARIGVMPCLALTHRAGRLVLFVRHWAHHYEPYPSDKPMPELPEVETV